MILRLRSRRTTNCFFNQIQLFSTKQFLGSRRIFSMAAKMNTLSLNKSEEQLTNIFLEVSKLIGQETEQEPELRFAGGWVRDKLFGIESHDIDVAVDCMPGYDFAKRLQTYLQEKHPECRTRIVKIDANPEKSKHLETATAKILGKDIDFVNLRPHTFSNSHLHLNTSIFGTPLEDALRRDATVNALFYNLRTKQVEDFTEKGLSDLENKIIRTPLPADETFSDDPLRAVRCIRFASKFNFEIHPDTFLALKNHSLHERLRSNISRERIGVEIDKILSHCDTSRAFRIIHDSGLFAPIFGPLLGHYKNIVSKNLDSLSLIPKAIDLFDQLREEAPSFKNLSCSVRYVFWVAVAVLPWHNWTYVEKSKERSLAPILVRDSLKYSKPIILQVESLYTHYPAVMKRISTLSSHVELSRLEYGKLVRELGQYWKDVINWAFFMNLLTKGSFTEEVDEAVNKVLPYFDSLIKNIEDHDLTEAYSIQPVLNGKELSSLLNTKPGPHLKQMLEESVEWKLQFPDRKKEDYIKFVTEKYKTDSFGQK
ncbi:tRNA nucleotidyltransferase [Schizosaccharomyces cryophilus OY26]|uniref:tRNA nucleotidyltransferase n=1 Tax=Schizosaccharomyces cryophilus (strain OY26 / ATCC MYA-4695 / CBS 11777 / NBRC 106824 / NRRL Y48691) TaxID=653667 RepID=S9VR34_SCHCR|nr:tRNA nucleotidyltransferase [Schizosaccharomyces cryophilus OY26]EPY50393.1 tRNA nucleotidyltransferase [Schizosaccharomyces cryophilus OY26]